MKRILKFGGSSVGTPGRIKNVLKIIRQSFKSNGKIAVVVSAFGGVTNDLVKIANSASMGDATYLTMLNELQTKHLHAVKELVNIKRQSGVIANVKSMLNELEDLLHGVFLIRELTPRILDCIMSFGERLSGTIIAEGIKESGITANFLDARQLIITDDSFGNALVDFEVTNKKIKKYFQSEKKLQVITGFIASTAKNETTTLGRSGSDYTAAIFGAALNANEIEIWTDVDGILTADPRVVKKAFPLNRISYREAMELSHFGAKVIFPATMVPAMNSGIPIRIKNSFNPSASGTLITLKTDSEKFIIKGISSVQNVAVLNLQGSGMAGVVGISQRLFTALARKKVNVILISQASSEYSICIAVEKTLAHAGKNEIEKEFAFEIHSGKIEKVIIEDNKSILAIVGENMRRSPGIAGRMFNALGKNGINISAIAQGSSELNISVVIDETNRVKALNVLHEAFFLSDTKSLNVFMVGTGVVGKALLRVIVKQQEQLLNKNKIDLRLIAVANSRKMIFSDDGIHPSTVEGKLNSALEKMKMEVFLQKMKEMNLPNSVFVDNTSSDSVVEHYADILRSSISVVTPNKKANSGKYSEYLKIKNAATKHGVKYFYETNVGAGLPVINTLNDLTGSGDTILKIEAILSGTISYIFNSFDESISFSELVKKAKEMGYTEPDPRDDLNGMDVARKLLILSREAGHPLEMKDIIIENILPKNLLKPMSIENFLTELKKSDLLFEKKRKDASLKNCKLRYIARLENGKAIIRLEEINDTHPFYFLSGTDNIIAYTTERYKNYPLVVKGPGAGAEVTAAGVFADVIKIIN